MTCDEIRPLLATRRQLPYAQERAVQTHLSNCARCTAVWQREERIMRQFRTLPAPAGELAEDTKQALRRNMHMQRARRHQRLQRWVLAGIASTIILVAMLFQPTVRDYIGQTIGQSRPLSSSPIAPPRPTASSTLYIASSITDNQGQAIIGARVTAIDLATWHERYRVEGGDEATLSPDGARLYVAGTRPGAKNVDEVRAIETKTGQELWHTAIQHRAGYPGQSNLVVSPDGHWLYLRSYDTTRGSGNAVTVPFWLQIIDTTNGAIQPMTIALPNIGECGAPTLASPPVGHVIYLSCYNNRILAINTQTQQIEPLLLDEVNGAILSPNAHEMYAVNATLGVFVLDSLQRTILGKITMRPTPPFSSSHGLIALSGDGKRLVAGQTIEGTPGTDTACEIRVFDRTTGAEIGQFRYEEPLYAFVVDRLGTTLYAVIGGVSDMTIVEFGLPNGVVQAVRERPTEQINQMFVGK
jgi:hypothetical protein